MHFFRTKVSLTDFTPVNINGSVSLANSALSNISIFPDGLKMGSVYGIKLAVAFLEYDYLDCQLLKGFEYGTRGDAMYLSMWDCGFNVMSMAFWDHEALALRRRRDGFACTVCAFLLLHCLRLARLALCIRSLGLAYHYDSIALWIQLCFNSCKESFLVTWSKTVLLISFPFLAHFHWSLFSPLFASCIRSFSCGNNLLPTLVTL